MRSIFLVLLLIPTLPLTVRLPFAGILVWLWVSIMNPHRETFGFTVDFPLLDFVAVATIVGWLFSGERKTPPGNPVLGIILAFFAWTSITTIFSQDIEMSYKKWEHLAKIMLLLYIMMCLVTTRERLFSVVAVMCLSLAYWSVWGGVGGIVNAGRYMFTGPPGSMLEDRNALAMAVAMMAPLMFWAGAQLEDKRLRIAAYTMGCLTVMCVVTTQSRGGFVCLVVMAAWLLVRSQHRVKLAALFAVVGITGATLLAENYTSRMAGISEAAATDGSAQGRLQMWRYGIDVAHEFPINGAGFRVYHNGVLGAKLLPEGVPLRASHSNYFEVLAEHGYIGLFLFLWMMSAAVILTWRIRSLTKGRDDLLWARQFGLACEFSVLAYAIGGAFLEVSTLEIFYYIVGLVICTNAIVLRALASAPQPSAVPPAPLAPATGRWHPAE